MSFGGYILFVQIVIVILSILFTPLLSFGLSWVPGSSVPTLSAYAPEWVWSSLKYLFSMSFLWSLLTAFNHWNDFTTLIIQTPITGDFMSFLGTIFAWFWVTNIDIGYQFFHTLFNNPGGLLQTVAVQELILGHTTFRELITDGFHAILTSLTGRIPIGAPLFNVIQQSYDTLVGAYTNILNGIGTAFVNVWTAYVGGIYNAITPLWIPRFIAPVVEPIFHASASAIAVSAVLLTIKVISWFF